MERQGKHLHFVGTVGKITFHQQHKIGIMYDMVEVPYGECLLDSKRKQYVCVNQGSNGSTGLHRLVDRWYLVVMFAICATAYRIPNRDRQTFVQIHHLLIFAV